MEIIFMLPPPPSLNDARIAIRLKKKGARITDSPELRAWKEMAKIELAAQNVELPEWIKKTQQNKQCLVFIVEWWGKHWYKNGKPKRRDLDNRIKFLMDAVFNYIELDDSLVFDLRLVKIEKDTDEEYCICKIKPL